jgi:hypothetical protein
MIADGCSSGIVASGRLGGGGGAGSSPPGVQQNRYGLGQLQQMVLQRRGQGIQPVLRADEVLQTFVGENILDTKGDHRDALMNRSFHLPFDLLRIIGTGRKNQDQGMGFLDRIKDRFAPIAARQDIPGSNPAADAMGFQGGDHRIGDGAILMGIADKNIVGHWYFLPEV